MAEKLLRDHQVEAQIVSAGFSHNVHAITASGDAHRALEFLQRVQRVLDSGYRCEFVLRSERDARRFGGRR